MDYTIVLVARVDWDRAYPMRLVDGADFPWRLVVRQSFICRQSFHRLPNLHSRHSLCRRQSLHNHSNLRHNSCCTIIPQGRWRKSACAATTCTTSTTSTTSMSDSMSYQTVGGSVTAVCPRCRAQKLFMTPTFKQMSPNGYGRTPEDKIEIKSRDRTSISNMLANCKLVLK